MKSLFSLLLVALIFVSCTNKNTRISIEEEQKLKALLEQKDYFKLQKTFDKSKDMLSEEKQLFFKSVIDNAFNRNDTCVAKINKLLQQPSSKLTDSAKATLYFLLDDSYFKLYEYYKAAQVDQILLKKYIKCLGKDEVDDIKNKFTIRNALKNIPAQQTIIKESTTINWTKNSVGLTQIPVGTGASKCLAVFDTRANISTISKTYADKLRLHMLNVSYNEGSGATGIQFKTSMGIADSLNIGSIIVKNVLFQVMPDSILYIAPIKLQLNVIIGYPVIAQLQEIHLFKDGRMTIPLSPSQRPLHNLALDQLDPVYCVKDG